MTQFILVTGPKSETTADVFENLPDALDEYRERMSWGSELILAQVLIVNLVTEDLSGEKVITQAKESPPN